MVIKVRFGTKDDIDALVDVECSWVKEWHHYSSRGQGAPAQYNELRPWERVMHGGPWMDKTALRKYWERVKRLRITSLVAETDGKVVGHLDVIFSYEHTLGRFLYLDVLTVHKAYRRKGVAKNLIKEAEKLARNRKAGSMLVEPEKYEGPSGLTYRSYGFEKAFDVYTLEASIDHQEMPHGIQLIPIPQIQRAPIKTHTMICGWYNITAKVWDYNLNPDVELLHAFHCHQLTFSALTNSNLYFFHVKQNYFDHSTGTIYLWAPTHINQNALQLVLRTVKTIASWFGMKRLTTRSIQKNVAPLERAGFILKSKDEPYLIKTVT